MLLLLVYNAIYNCIVTIIVRVVLDTFESAILVVLYTYCWLSKFAKYSLLNRSFASLSWRSDMLVEVLQSLFRFCAHLVILAILDLQPRDISRHVPVGKFIYIKYI